MSQQDYEDPRQRGALGGVRAFVQTHKLKDPEAKQLLQQVLSYTLHKPVRKRFPTAPTLVFGRDEQWQMDLVDMQKLNKLNKGYKYMLTVIDVFSKKWPGRNLSRPRVPKTCSPLCNDYPFTFLPLPFVYKRIKGPSF